MDLEFDLSGRCTTDYSIGVLGLEFAVSRNYARVLLTRAKKVGELEVFSRRRGRVCYLLGRTPELHHVILLFAEVRR